MEHAEQCNDNESCYMPGYKLRHKCACHVATGSVDMEELMRLYNAQQPDPKKKKGK